MGKWSVLRGAVPPAPVDNAWQQTVNIEKTRILADLPNIADKGNEYVKLRDAKDNLEEQVRKLNVQLEALSQLLVGEMEKNGLEMIRLVDGHSLSIKDSPYSSVEDKDKFIAWIKATGQEDLLSVHYQTMNSITTHRLENGQEPPPGIKVFLKQSITKYRPR